MLYFLLDLISYSYKVNFDTEKGIFNMLHLPISGMTSCPSNPQ